MRPALLVLALCSCGLVTPSGAGGGAGGGGGSAGGVAGGAAGGAGGGSAGAAGGGSAGGAAPSWTFATRELAAHPRFVAAHGYSATDFWVVSLDGGLFHTDGVALSSPLGPAGVVSVTTLPDRSVYAVSATALYACLGGCDAPGTAIFDATSPTPASTQLTATCSHPSFGAWAVGNDQGNSAVYRYAGSWERLKYTSNIHGYQSCFVDAHGWSWSTGVDGVVGVQTDAGWTVDPVGLTSPQAQWWSGTGTDAGRVIGGTGWRILTREGPGSQWQTVTGTADGGGVVRALATLGGNDVVAGGTFESNRGLMIRQGGQWRGYNPPIDVSALFVVDPTRFVAVGQHPTNGTAVLITATFH